MNNAFQLQKFSTKGLICTVIFYPHLPLLISDSPPPSSTTSDSAFVLNNSNATIIEWNGSCSLRIRSALTDFLFSLKMISETQPPRSS